MRLLVRSFILLLLVSTVIPVMARAAVSDTRGADVSGDEEALEKPFSSGKWITADHSRLPLLQQEFTSGPEVTAVCLECHNEAGKQVMESIHWTWICPADPTGRMGKNGLTLNNF